MNTTHANEESIQLYAAHPESCSIAARNHIAGCQDCLAQVALYAQVFTAVQNAQVPAFEFDLSQLVLQQLPKSKPVWVHGFTVTCLLLVVAFSAAGWLFHKELLHLFTGMLSETIYLIIIGTAAIALFQAIDMYRKYEKLIDAI